MDKSIYRHSNLPYYSQLLYRKSADAVRQCAEHLHLQDIRNGHTSLPNQLSARSPLNDIYEHFIAILPFYYSLPPLLYPIETSL